MDEHGTAKALAGAGLQLVGGLLIGGALWLAYLDGTRNPISLGLGGFAALYFTVSGAVRLSVGFLTRRAGG